MRPRISTRACVRPSVRPHLKMPIFIIAFQCIRPFYAFLILLGRIIGRCAGPCFLEIMFYACLSCCFVALRRDILFHFITLFFCASLFSAASAGSRLFTFLLPVLPAVPVPSSVLSAHNAFSIDSGYEKGNEYHDEEDKEDVKLKEAEKDGPAPVMVSNTLCPLPCCTHFKFRAVFFPYFD